MKRLRTIIQLAVGFCLSVASLQAKQLKPNQAVQRAFLSQANARLKSADKQQLKLVQTVADSLGNNLIYIYQHLQDDRLVFLSADDCAKPLLGCTDGPVSLADTMPAMVQEWIDFYKQQISYGIAKNLAFEDLPLASPQNGDGRLKRDDAPDFVSIPVLLPYEWGTVPFNALCPQYNGQPTKVGCVALTLYQIMSYYSYPTVGRDTVQYVATVEDEERLLELDLAPSVYDWEALKDLETEEGKAAAAILGRDCAYAVKASFGVGNTSAKTTNLKEAFLRYFNYDSCIVIVGRSNNPMWFRTVYNELANGRPIAYAGYGTYGHSFVCDGYDAGTNNFHFNWHWYGKYNGYYSLYALTPGEDFFDHDHIILVGVQPPGSYKKGTDHVFCYGDLTLQPQIVGRKGCTSRYLLNASSTENGFAAKGVFFAPPCYPTAQVALIMRDAADAGAEPVYVVANYGEMIHKVQATYEQSLFIPYDCFAMSNAYQFIKPDVDYVVSLAYRDFPDEEFRPVAFPFGGKETSTIRMCQNGQFVCSENGVNPLLSTAWYYPALNTQCPVYQGYLNCSAGYDAAALGQMMYSLQVPPMVFGTISYDGHEVDSLPYRLTFDNPAAELPYIGKAIRTNYSLNSAIHSEAAMVYGLHKNMGLKHCQFMKRQFYTTAQWMETAVSQLSQGSPLYYSGYHVNKTDSVRRAFVVDGYDADELFHINFGEAGMGDKYADLNVLNFKGGRLGGIDECYTFDQVMLIDFFTQCDVDTLSGGPEHPFMLKAPLVVNGNPSLTLLECDAACSISVGFELEDCLKHEADYRAEGFVLIGVGLFANGELLETLSSTEVALAELSGEIAFTLGRMPAGDYELALVSSTNGTNWERVYNYAPNSIRLVADNEILSLQIPFNASQGARLQMGGAYQLEEDTANGLLLHLPLENPTLSNFSNYLRVVATFEGGESVVYDGQPAAVYGNTVADYYIALPEDMLSALNGGAKLSAYYKAEDGWLPLFGDTGTEIVKPDIRNNGGVKVFNAKGQLLANFAPNQIQDQYARFLLALPAGVYVAQENGIVRKFVKTAN